MNNPMASTTTLYSPQAVAELAGIAPKTMYQWIARGLVKNTFDLQGRPIFTREEAAQIAALAEQRRQVAEAMRLPVSA